MKTKQELFTTVKDHLLEQGKRSSGVGENGHQQCLYRGPNGMKCAVGAVIPDEYYLNKFEGKYIYQIIPLLSDAGYKELDGHCGMLADLQKMHDKREPCVWEVRLKGIAKRHDLEY